MDKSFSQNNSLFNIHSLDVTGYLLKRESYRQLTAREYNKNSHLQKDR